MSSQTNWRDRSKSDEAPTSAEFRSYTNSNTSNHNRSFPSWNRRSRQPNAPDAKFEQRNFNRFQRRDTDNNYQPTVSHSRSVSSRQFPSCFSRRPSSPPAREEYFNFLDENDEPSPMQIKLKTALNLSPSDLILKLEEEEIWFCETLEQLSLENESDRNETAVFIHLINNVLKSHMHSETQKRLLKIILHSGFFKIIIPEYLQRSFEEENTNKILSNLVSIFLALSTRFPNLALKELKMCVNKCSEAVSAYTSSLENTSCHIVPTLQYKLKAIKEIIDKTENHTNSNDAEKPCEYDNKVESTDENPNNYRNVPVIPEVSEIICDQRPDLKKNIIQGSFDDVEHYLDVQFRLLREDYVAPLREGICEFRQQQLEPRNTKWRFQNVRLYQGVRIVEPILKFNGSISYEINFDVGHFKTKNWASSRRLINGSLLCISNDFFKTIHFATVDERNPQDLAEGIITVAFVNEKDEGYLFDHLNTSTYLMAESPAFFEAYRPILQGLKTLIPSTMPLQRFLVKVETEMTVPEYIQVQPTYDISFLCKKQNNVRRAKQVHILNLNSWPAATDIGLDDSQRRAMQLALCNSIGIVQGPPGTGKTYIGLKIVQALLRNAPIGSPILVVCLTNHALDQFLEGMLSFSSKLIRVGGRSQNESLDRYNLRRAINKERRETPSVAFSRISVIEEDLHRIRCIRLNHDKYKKMKNSYILHENVLRNLPEPDATLVKNLSEKFFYRNSLKNSAMFSWLGLLLDDAVNEYDLQDFLWCEEADAPEQHTDENEVITNEDSASEVKSDEVAEKVLIDVEDEATMETKNRILDLEFEHSDWIEIYTDNDVAECEKERLKIDSLSDPYFMYNLQLYIGQELKDITDEYVRRDLKWLQNNYEFIREQCHLLKQMAEREVIKTDRMLDSEVHNISRVYKHMWSVPLKDRWRLYRRWEHIRHTMLENRMKQKLEIYKKKSKVLKELISQTEYDTLKKADVIGMTTTGAAKYQATLHELGCKTVVIEEAAEVLESHVVSLLNPETQHLILIGDHQQLRPKTTTFYLAREYKMDVSLFERMIRNNLPYVTLEQQHRMRPQISQLIRKHIYPNLQDHFSVYGYPNVRGVQHDVFFLNHSHQEKVLHADSKTHVNVFEANFVVELCRYLLQQGYKPTQITILAAYMGQSLEIRQHMPKEDFEGVRVTVIDNYQGEENDIVILSLVRSNTEGAAGFMKVDNRLNVALSRAKHGLYAVGNFDLFSESSSFWEGLIDDLNEQKLTGRALPIVCQNHPDCSSLITSDLEFRQKAPHGGCLQKCSTLLKCGHQCNKFCHIGEHGVCQEPCMKSCPEGHPCPLKCLEGCTNCRFQVIKRMSCEHDIETDCSQDPEECLCQVQVQRTLTCGHTLNARCYKKLEDLKCKENCTYRLECGHTCPLKCHTASDSEHEEPPCEQPCEMTVCPIHEDEKCSNKCKDDCSHCPVVIETELSCGHPIEIECGLKYLAQCSAPCEKILSCGHKCPEICGVKCSECMEMVDKRLPCGHNFKVPCIYEGYTFKEITHNHLASKTVYHLHQNSSSMAKSPKNSRLNFRLTDPIICQEDCIKLLDCGHKCQKSCGLQCTKLCEINVTVKGSCNHEIQLLCQFSKLHQDLINLYCKQPCGAQLSCTHDCAGTCGECFQGRVHLPCESICGRLQVCGHACEIPCSELCPPCNRKCPNRCQHNRCPKKCGYPCKYCRQRCEWKCPHQRCTKRCGEDCDRPPCNEPCGEILRCGHPCIGMCGEICPIVCRTCKPDELTDFILSGLEDDPEARFVMLEDCRHCFEVSAMDHWMNMDNEVVGMKCCPKCKATIWRSQRYNNIIRRCFKDVEKVKKKIYGNTGNLRQKMGTLYDKLKESKFIKKRFPEAYESLKVRLSQKQTLNYGACNVVENQILLLNAMTLLWDLPEAQVHKDVAEYVETHSAKLADRLIKYEYKMTEQELEGISRECRRITLQARLAALEKQPDSCKSWSQEDLNELNIIKSVLLSGLPLNDVDEKKTYDMIRSLQKLEGMDVTEEERVLIVKAIDVGKKGHWFKCPNGHFYAIGECGGAMQISKCIECGAQVGGTDHNLVSTNEHAREIDNSQFAQYSDTANLANFDPRDFLE